MPNKPKSFFIIPSFENSEFSSTNSQGGVSFGTGSAGVSNNGALTVLGTGTPRLSSIKDLTLRVQDSGSLNSTTFIYKETLQADTLYKGENDRRYSHLHSSPFPYQAGEPDDPNYYGYGLSIGYTSQNDREFVLIVDYTQSNTIKIAYRDIFTSNLYNDDGGWSTTTLNLFSLFGKKIAYSGSLSCSLAQTATCTLDNGKALIFIRTHKDIDVYLTSDGTTWEMIAENIIGRFFTQTDKETINVQYFNLSVSSSGNYVKLVTTNYVDGEHHLFTMVSSDRGFTWQVCDRKLAIAGQSASSGGDRFSFSITGIQETGRFILCNVNNSTNSINTYVSSGVNEFKFKSNLNVTYNVNQVVGPEISLCKGTDSTILFCDYLLVPSAYVSPPSDSLQAITNVDSSETGDYNSNNGEQCLFEIPHDTNLDLASWYDYGQFPFEMSMTIDTSHLVGGSVETTLFRYPSQTTSFRGSNYYRFYRLRMINVGSSIALCSSLRKTRVQPSIGEKSGLVYMRYGGFDYKPINDFYTEEKTGGIGHAPNRHKPTYILYSPEWVAWNGAPAGVLYSNGSDSAWKETRSIATRAVRTDRLQIGTNLGNTTTNKLFYEYRDNRGWTNGNNQGYASPMRNWCFSQNNVVYNPITNENILPTEWYRFSSGCCVEWSCRVSDTLTLPATEEGHCAVRIEGYIHGLANPVSNSSFTCAIEVRIFRDVIKVYDHASGTNLATIDVTTTGKNVYNSYFEFRLGFSPSYRSESTQCRLMCRPVGTSDWLKTSALVVNTSFTPLSFQDGLYRQRITFGMIQATAANYDTNGIEQFWKYVRVHPCNDFDMEGLSIVDFKDNIRGHEITNNLIYLQDGQSVLWGGSSGSEGDLFTLESQYANSVKNILHFNSPRQQWRSAGSTSYLETIFNVPSVDSNHTRKEPVSGIGIIGTNGTSIELAGAVSIASAYTTVTTINLERTRGRVTSTFVKEHTFEVEFDGGKVPYAGEYQSGSENGSIKFYSRFGTLGGGSANITTDEHHVILDHYEGSSNTKQYIQLKGLHNNSTIAVGTTLIVYGDRGYGCFTANRTNGYYRLRINGTNNEEEGYLYCGSAVVGNTLQINPDLNWDHSVSVESNNTPYRSRSGIEWAYTEGPSSRSLQGTIIGDVTEQMRNKLKNNIRRATNFDKKPLYFVLQDGIQDSSQIFYGKVEVGVNDNQGYYYDDNSGQWRSLGNMTLTIIENV